MLYVLKSEAFIWEVGGGGGGGGDSAPHSFKTARTKLSKLNTCRGTESFDKLTSLIKL